MTTPFIGRRIQSSRSPWRHTAGPLFGQVGRSQCHGCDRRDSRSPRTTEAALTCSTGLCRCSSPKSCLRTAARGEDSERPSYPRKARRGARRDSCSWCSRSGTQDSAAGFGVKPQRDLNAPGPGVRPAARNASSRSTRRSTHSCLLRSFDSGRPGSITGSPSTGVTPPPLRQVSTAGGCCGGSRAPARPWLRLFLRARSRRQQRESR